MELPSRSSEASENWQTPKSQVRYLPIELAQSQLDRVSTMQRQDLSLDGGQIRLAFFDHNERNTVLGRSQATKHLQEVMAVYSYSRVNSFADFAHHVGRPHPRGWMWHFDYSRSLRLVAAHLKRQLCDLAADKQHVDSRAVGPIDFNLREVCCQPLWVWLAVAQPDQRPEW